ncbi:MAG: hypothetical protein V1888_00830 [archaeon]
MELSDFIKEVKGSGLVVPGHADMNALAWDMSSSSRKEFPNVMIIYLDARKNYECFLSRFKKSKLADYNLPIFCVPLTNKFTYFNSFCATQILPDFKFTKVEVRHEIAPNGRFYREFFDGNTCDTLSRVSNHLKVF